MGIEIKVNFRGHMKKKPASLFKENSFIFISRGLEPLDKSLHLSFPICEMTVTDLISYDSGLK